MTLAIQTSAFWDTTAASYVASAEPFTSQFCEDAVALASVAPGVTLLDVATGPGAAAFAAARIGAVVTAIDFSQAMIDRVAAGAGGLPIEARRMDGQALDLPDASFDRVISVFGVPLFPDWRAGLREIVRVLKPGGIALVATADNPFGFGPNTLFAEARAALFPAKPPAFAVDAMIVLADAARFCREMIDAGLADPVVHARTHDFVMRKDFFASSTQMLTDSPLLAGLSPDDARQVIDHVAGDVDRYQDGDTARLPGTAHLVVATKL